MAMADRIRRFRADRGGAAAIEFAFIAPILLALYFVTMEVAQGIEANRKVGRVGSMVADLVTQQQWITKAEVDAIMAIGEATLQPYNRTRPKIIVTAISISNDATPKATVVWSRKLANGTASQDAAPGATVTVPPKLNIANTFLVRVSGELDYRPMITWTAQQKSALGLVSAFDSIAMKETYYLRPRMSSQILCGDC